MQMPALATIWRFQVNSKVANDWLSTTAVAQDELALPNIRRESHIAFALLSALLLTRVPLAQAVLSTFLVTRDIGIIGNDGMEGVSL